MAEGPRDIWAEWLLHKGTAGEKEGWVNFLRLVRDRMLGNAQLSGGETFLLDVGAGDGLIAFSALIGRHSLPRSWRRVPNRV